MVCKTFNEFEARWKDKCSKIEKTEINESQARDIANGFLDEILLFYSKCDDKDNKGRGTLLMKEIFNDLDLALQIAISNYKKTHTQGILSKIFGFKNFQMDINKFKSVINQ